MARRPRSVPKDEKQPAPLRIHDPKLKFEMHRALIWIALVLAVAGTITLIQPILLIASAMLLSILFGGAGDALGRLLPIPRGVRVILAILAIIALLLAVFWYAGTTLAAQAEALRLVVTAQIDRLMAFATRMGLVAPGARNTLGPQLFGQVGQLTKAVGSVIGAVGSVVVVLALAIFFALEPRIYDRGVAWLVPASKRRDYLDISAKIGATMRRLVGGQLVGMVFEGTLAWLLLWVGGVPFAALLGLLTGLLAFLPNIGALVSGSLMIAVGFSASPAHGLYAIFVYFLVHNLEGYVVWPYIARRTVDLPPAVTLIAQLLFGTLLGLLGVLLAVPTVAAAKVLLEELSRRQAREDAG